MVLDEGIEAIATTVIDCAFKMHVDLGPGLLLNFNTELFKHGVKRVINNYAR